MTTFKIQWELEGKEGDVFSCTYTDWEELDADEQEEVNETVFRTLSYEKAEEYARELREAFPNANYTIITEGAH